MAPRALVPPGSVLHSLARDCLAFETSSAGSILSKLQTTTQPAAMAKPPTPSRDLSAFPELVLLRIADYLTEEDVTRLRQTCRRLHGLLPAFLVMAGPDFKGVPGSGTGWGDVEPYFDGPSLYAGVRRLIVSVASWRDQGWGNKKGELFVRLMRPADRAASSSAGKDEKKRGVAKFFGGMAKKRNEENEAGREGEMVAERRDFFGLAEHHDTSGRLEMDESEAVVSRARPGDWYRFMRRVGGGGGHRLYVSGFRAAATLEK